MAEQAHSARRRGRRGRGVLAGVPGSHRAFTLIEVLVAVLLLAVAVTGVMGGIRALGAADVAARHADTLQRLAEEKARQVIATGDPTTAGSAGDFKAEGYPNVSWSLETQASGAENVDQIWLKATSGSESQTVTCLMYVRPKSGTTSP